MGKWQPSFKITYPLFLVLLIYIYSVLAKFPRNQSSPGHSISFRYSPNTLYAYSELPHFALTLTNEFQKWESGFIQLLPGFELGLLGVDSLVGVFWNPSWSRTGKFWASPKAQRPVGFDSIASRAQDKDFNRIENWRFPEIVWGFLENLYEGDSIGQLGMKNIPRKLGGGLRILKEKQSHSKVKIQAQTKNWRKQEP